MSLQGNSWKKDYEQRERHHVENKDQRDDHHDDQQTQWNFQRVFWLFTGVFTLAGLFATIAVTIGKHA